MEFMSIYARMMLGKVRSLSIDRYPNQMKILSILSGPRIHSVTFENLPTYRTIDAKA